MTPRHHAGVDYIEYTMEMMNVNVIAPDILERIKNYKAGADEATVAEVDSMVKAAEAGDGAGLTALTEAFGRDLDFGTGGLRGLMGTGTNRMNRIVVAKATQGLAQYVKSQDAGGAVVIAYDSRNNSRDFAREAARVVAGNGLTAYLFEDLRPTPELSFAVRHLRATAGVVVTASHNPKEYNGYKVSWNDGAQVLPPHDRAIIEQVRAVHTMDQVHLADYESAIRNGSIVLVGADVDEAFLKALQSIRLRPELTEQHGGELKIVYTPLHGVGIRVVPRALEQWGFSNVTVVQEQSEPDGNFPTTKSPNPEERVALELALQLAERQDADIVLATDPDADRLGFAVKHEGEFRLVTGNQAGALIAWYLCETLKEQGRLPSNAAMVTTVVTTSLIKAVTDSYGVHLGLCLTGFKHIANLMREYEKPGPDGAPQKIFLMGCEESYGYLVGDHCRDKDAVGAACVVAEMAAWARSQGLTLIDILHKLYREHGVHVETQVSQNMPGLSGMKDMEALMARLRENPPRDIAGIAVERVTDIEQDTITNLAAGTTTEGPHLPKSNVLIFDLADGSKVVARPSGTEPKIKYYFMVVDRETLPISELDIPQRVEACTAKDEMLRKAWAEIVAAGS